MGLNRTFFSTVQAEITFILANSVHFAFLNHPSISWTERETNIELNYIELAFPDLFP